jgi:hypothetical protein
LSLGEAEPTAPIKPMPRAAATIATKTATLVLLNTTCALLP